LLDRITGNVREDEAHYRGREVDRVTDADPEGFYRLRIESDAIASSLATRHLNITRAELDRIRAVLTGGRET
jgi:hypothetical protein